jgi:hypothetical protein
MPYKNPEDKKRNRQAHYEANKDAIKQYLKKYREANKEELKARRAKNPQKRDPEVVSAYGKAWYAEHKDKILQRHKNSREERRFGIALRSSRYNAKKRNHEPCKASKEEIQSRFDGACQNPGCRIPESECDRRLSLDHDHETGAFRGWLCTNCNVMLGSAEDNPAILLGLINYLEFSRKPANEIYEAGLLWEV